MRVVCFAVLELSSKRGECVRIDAKRGDHFLQADFPLLIGQTSGLPTCNLVLRLMQERHTQKTRGRPVVFPMSVEYASCWKPKGALAMKRKTEVPQGTLALMMLRTLDVLGPLHGYGIARRIEQISRDVLAVNQGTLYPVLLKLEQEGSIASEYGASENNRRARFYCLTRDERKQLQAELRDWEQTAGIIGRFFELKAEDLS